MKGTNVDEGHQILADVGPNLITASDLCDAAAQIVAIALKHSCDP